MLVNMSLTSIMPTYWYIAQGLKTESSSRIEKASLEVKNYIQVHAGSIADTM